MRKTVRIRETPRVGLLSQISSQMLTIFQQEFTNNFVFYFFHTLCCQIFPKNGHNLSIFSLTSLTNLFLSLFWANYIFEPLCVLVLFKICFVIYYIWKYCWPIGESKPSILLFTRSEISELWKKIRLGSGDINNIWKMHSTENLQKLSVRKESKINCCVLMLPHTKSATSMVRMFYQTMIVTIKWDKNVILLQE